MQNLIFEGEPCLSNTRGNQAWLTTHATNRQTELTPKVCKVSATQMTPLHVLQLVPNSLTGIEVRRVGRELLHMKLQRSTVRHIRAHLPLMHGRALPAHQPFVRDVRQHMPEND